jgi:hypothetical protein
MRGKLRPSPDLPTAPRACVPKGQGGPARRDDVCTEYGYACYDMNGPTCCTGYRDSGMLAVVRLEPWQRPMAAMAWCVPLLLFLPSVGMARSAKDRGHRVRLHADTEAFGFTHVSRGGAPGNTNIVGFGLGRPPFLDGGFVRPVWGLGLAYVFAGQRAVLGARFAFAVDGVFRTDDVASTTSVAGNFVPYFRWVFLHGRRFRPYVTVRFGLGGGTLIEPLDESSNFQVSSFWPTAGAGTGLHAFVTDELSLDLGLDFDYAAPHAITKSETEFMTAVGGLQSANVFSLGLLVGFSVWFR